MEIQVLSDKQKEECAEWLKSYKFCYFCDECGESYGSDFLEENKLCPEHSNKKGFVKDGKS